MSHRTYLSVEERLDRISKDRRLDQMKLWCWVATLIVMLLAGGWLIAQLFISGLNAL